MRNEDAYSDEDTERVRQAEMQSTFAGSAGQPTIKLPGQLPPHSPPPDSRRSDFLALALIATGLLWLLAQFMPNSQQTTEGMVLLTIASCFLFFAFWRRIYVLLIPGSILAGLSVGVPFAQLTHGVSVLWGLALGYFCILLLGRSLYGVRSVWAVYPAVILFGVGTITAIANMPAFLAGGLLWLPLLLIGAGLYLGWLRQKMA
jgi:uncharacterized membrane protein